ncbi:MAG TPA: hypothetical protein VEY30_14360 [Myxococcaceae bacterium]|nr:hypothetical protein [Myxococcaceae bacterium]
MSSLTPEDLKVLRELDGGFNPGVPKSADGPELYRNYVHHRRLLGYGLGGAAIVGVLGLSLYSYCALSGLKVPTNPWEAQLLWIHAGGHAAIAVGLVYFCYQLLRAAERLALPYWWVSENPDVARVLLGIADPLSSLKKLASAVGPVTGRR